VLLAELLLRQGRIDEAEEQFGSVLAGSPREFSALALRGLGEVRMKQGRLDDAATYFTATLEIRPDSAESLFLLGTVQLLAGRPAQALTALQKATALRPGQTAFLVHLAHALHETGQIAPARQLYRQ